MCPKILILLFVIFHWAGLQLFAQAAVTPGEPISLLDDPDFSDFTHHLWSEESTTDKREEAWSVNADKIMHVSGKGWGYLRTNTRYRDYHLVLEYKWGEHTFGSREDRARDNGLLVHGFGKDGLLLNSWISSIEAQLIEGGSGDILVLAPRDEDGTKAPTRATAKVRPDRDGEPVWSPDGRTQVFPPAEKPVSRINWWGRDPDWKDEKGFHGEKDIENPVGEWNRMEVICREDTIRILLNGQLVNEVFDVFPTEGFVCIQSEGAELRIRRFELWPLDSFREEWQPRAASTNTGASETGESLLPRRFPWSPERSQAAWRIDGDYEMQLVAAEPIVNDPVDLVWNEHGQMFVVEMRDYPVPTETGTLLSRIRLLSDEDGDGRMDKATTWADEMDHVQGLVPYDGGLIATTRTAVLFLKDTDGDGKADLTRSLYTSSDPRHSQVQVSSGRWGPDNAIYFNNGLDTREIYPSNASTEVLPIRGWDLRYDPQMDSLTRVTGRGQYGASFDDWGRRFFCSNRNPIMFALMPVEAMERNPHAALTKGYEDIHPVGASLRPILVSHTTAATHLGTFTAACGLGVYRGDWMPELNNDIFVCDPTGQVVTRNRLLSNGASFSTERIGEPFEFIASSDEWSRPVQVRNGPDGALYICDMYRRFIDHAIFFPDEFAETNYMRAGLDHGRIWRLVPKNALPRKIKPLPDSNAELVRLLTHDNAWQRTHAQRLLIERRATEVIPAIHALLAGRSSARGRVHALWTLKGLGSLTSDQLAHALRDTDPGVVETAIALSNPDGETDQLIEIANGHNERLRFLATVALGGSSVDLHHVIGPILSGSGLADPWIRAAILSARNPRSASLAVNVLKGVGRVSGASSSHSDDVLDFLKACVAETTARGDLDGLRLVVAQIDPKEPGYSDAAVVQGLVMGLSRGSVAAKSLFDLLQDPPAPLTRLDLAGVERTLESSAELSLDKRLPASQRIAALALVEELGEDEVFQVVGQLVDATEGPEMQLAACRTLARFDRQEVAEFFYNRWGALGPTARSQALEMIASHEDTGFELMRRMKMGEINPSLMPAFRRWWLGRRSDERIASLARELFGSVNEDRAAVIRNYGSALQDLPGDIERGRAVFVGAACATCHRKNELGVDVGPSLADIRFKPSEALLADILDPNRAVEDRWATYTIETKNGLHYSGLIAAETSSTLELKLPGGHSETIARNQIRKLESNGLSLMPVGLEGTLSKADMANLIAFLKSP